MRICLRRREFIAGLGGAAAVQSLGAYGQAPKLPVIGFLSDGPPRLLATYIAAFRDGIIALGYVEGRNMAITYRSAQGNSDQLGTLADDLVRSQVQLIVASGGVVSAKAATKAIASIPILFVSGFDPVDLGLVASLNKPGGNATGVSLFSTELVPKRLELLYALGPRIQKVGVLLNPASGTPDIEAREALAVARLKGYQIALFEASTASGIDVAFILAAEQHVSAFLITGSPFFSRQRAQIVMLAAQHGMPVMYPWREYVDDGGLMSYGTELTWGYKIIGQYAGRILKGQRPTELPVQQPAKFDFIINLKTAKQLGLTVPPTLFAFATEVIE